MSFKFWLNNADHLPLKLAIFCVTTANRLDVRFILRRRLRLDFFLANIVLVYPQAKVAFRQVFVANIVLPSDSVDEFVEGAFRLFCRKNWVAFGLLMNLLRERLGFFVVNILLPLDSVDELLRERLDNFLSQRFVKNWSVLINDKRRKGISRRLQRMRN